MGRLMAMARHGWAGAEGTPFAGRGTADLGPLAHRRLVVPLGLELVEAELVGVYGQPPHLQVRLALVSDGDSCAGRLEFDLHINDLPPVLQAALQDRPPAATRTHGLP